ncbi:MAG: hypothetical protein EOL88_03005 [Bacteroidia bacterium]|nr:hypothetical protein [Bacteroidia bacterium]
MKYTKNRFILILSVFAFVLTLYPFVLSFYMSGTSACFSYFAADAFYYLTVARNTSWLPVFSFDSICPTNGFHPLWQVYLKIIFSLFSLADDQTTQLLVAYFTSSVLVSISAALLVIVVYRLTRCSAIALTSVVPGFYYFIVAPTTQTLGTLWSFGNGMESPFSLLFFACLIFIMVKARFYSTCSRRLDVLVAIFVTLVVFSRLDDVFLIPALCLPLYWSRMSALFKFKKICTVIGIPTICVIFYCVFNFCYAGTMLPVSGLIKGHGGMLHNVLTTINILFPIKQVINSNWGQWQALTWRVLQNFIPASLAVGYIGLIIFKRKAQEALDGHVQFLMAASIFVVLKAMYNFVFVNYWHQGHWYYPLSICVANIILAVVISKTFVVNGIGRLPRLLKSKNRDSFTLILRCSPLFVAAFVGFYVANATMAEKAISASNQDFYKIWADREKIKAGVMQAYNGTGVIDYDDGIIAFLLGMPAMSGLGFALDLEAMRAKQSGSFLELAYRRGFSVLSTMQYMPAFSAAIGDDVSDQLKNVFWLYGEDLDRWSFKLVYQHADTACKFIAFEPVDITNRSLNINENPFH